MREGRPKPVQFTLWQLLLLTLIVSVFFAVWKATDSVLLASLVSIGIPLTMRLSRLNSKEWHRVHKGSVIEGIWVTLTLLYWIVVGLIALYLYMLPFMVIVEQVR